MRSASGVFAVANSVFLFLQIIEWYEEYAEEFFQTHTELGESLEIALALEQEVKQFEDSTQVSCSYRKYVNVCKHYV